ncbi:hypothetical protein [Streptomyces sp. RTd22]|uniref:hypothetical protein n=1 Tax=Streptomyces sp. RTd22 TaxID=1841249 RepID=UPI0007C5976B|nr:hypothetical protein [Streptomyces sp. RTd22]
MATYEHPDAFVEENLTTYEDTATVGTTTSTDYITNEQADARYQRLRQPVNLALPADHGPALTVQTDTDTMPRFQVAPDGVVGFGTGAEDPDVTLKRVGPALLGTDGTFTQGGHTVLDVSQVGIAGGIASLGPDGKLTASQLPSDAGGGSSNPNTTLQGTKGYTLPSTWGEFWRPKRDAAKAGAGKATIAVIGGSSTVGFLASRLRSKAWPGLLAASLQSTHGDGGTGFYTSLLSTQGIAGQESTAITTWTSSGELIGQTGTWNIGGYSAGPGWGYLYSSTNGHTLTFTVRGTSVTIFTLGADGQHSPWSYTIDSGTAVAVADTATTGRAVIATKVTGLSAGTHTVKLTHTGTSSQYLSVFGVAGENSTGIVLNNFARRNAVASEYLPTLKLPWNGGPNYPCDLVIYAVSADDIISGIDADAWATSVRQHLSNIRDGGAATGATDIVILLPHVGTADTATFCYQDFIDRADGLARAFDAAVINLWAMGRNSWNHWNSLGYWADPANAGAAGTDSVLMSDAGHSYVAGVINALLQS